MRTGRRNQPKFRLVAAEQGEKLDGKVVEILGHYEPAAEAKPFVFDKEKVQGWLSKGALPSNTVAKLLNKQGFDLPVHLYAEAKPRKKTQARAEAANKPSSDAKAMEDVSAETPKAVEEAVSDETAAESISVDAVPDETEAAVEMPVEKVAAEIPKETVAAEETSSSDAEAVADQGPVVEEAPAEIPSEGVSEEKKES